jgi:cytoskeletal protein CcmA (bactofilin family)
LNVTNDAHIGGDFQVDDNSDLDGTLDVQGATNLQSTLTVAGAADLNSTLDVDGDTELDTTNIDGSLTVRDFADFNDSLDVAKSVHVQDDLSVADSTSLNTAGNDGTVFTVFNSQGASAVTIETYDSSTSSGGSATTLTTPRLVVQEDAVYNGNLNVSGSASVTGNVTSAAAPTSPNHLTNKQYVDDAIAAAVTPPQIWDYDVVNSTSGDTVFYINGDLLLYATEEEATINYTIRLYGQDMNLTGDMAIDNMHLRARGNSRGLNNADNNLTVWAVSSGATFNIGYTDIKDLAGGQEDGYVSTHLTFTTVGGKVYNTGVTIRFYLDSTSAAASGATFSDPE